jgi:Cu2+-exporting ATPase
MRLDDHAPVAFRFEDALRPDAAEVVHELKSLGVDVMLLSGDHEAAVARVAARVGIARWRSHCLPTDKTGLLGLLRASGHNVLMVGDGMNDAPALASATGSMSPASAADIAQNAANLVFTGNRLAPVVTALRLARAARRTILQNFALAIAYNAFAVPIAMAGLATPLIAAIAMSSSSLIVTANSLRVPLALRQDRAPRPDAPKLVEATA